MSKYIVKTPVNHDKKDYSPGESIELEPAAAKALLAVGAIEAQAKAKSVKGQSAGSGE